MLEGGKINHYVQFATTCTILFFTTPLLLSLHPT